MATHTGALGFDVPSQARIYDYLLGGGHNVAAEQIVADKIAALAGAANRHRPRVRSSPDGCALSASAPTTSPATWPS